MNKVHDATKEYLKKDIPEFDTGDTLIVSVLVREGNKERVQNFEGVVIGRRAGKSLDATFTVRKISNGIGVERIFPLHSPMISNIDVKRKGKVRRAKLYYLRDREGKSARIAEKIKKNIGINVEVKTSTPEGTDKEAISEKKENEKIVPEKKITEKKEVKKSDNLK